MFVCVCQSLVMLSVSVLYDDCVAILLNHFGIISWEQKDEKLANNWNCYQQKDKTHAPSDVQGIRDEVVREDEQNPHNQFQLRCATHTHTHKSAMNGNIMRAGETEE